MFYISLLSCPHFSLCLVASPILFLPRVFFAVRPLWLPTVIYLRGAHVEKTDSPDKQVSTGLSSSSSTDLFALIVHDYTNRPSCPAFPLSRIRPSGFKRKWMYSAVNSASNILNYLISSTLS
jgi:hypothetical protein